MGELTVRAICAEAELIVEAFSLLKDNWWHVVVPLLSILLLWLVLVLSVLLLVLILVKYALNWSTLVLFRALWVLVLLMVCHWLVQE